jgi:hypothetical protein
MSLVCIRVHLCLLTYALSLKNADTAHLYARALCCIDFCVCVCFVCCVFTLCFVCEGGGRGEWKRPTTAVAPRSTSALGFGLANVSSGGVGGGEGAVADHLYLPPSGPGNGTEEDDDAYDGDWRDAHRESRGGGEGGGGRGNSETSTAMNDSSSPKDCDRYWTVSSPFNPAADRRGKGGYSSVPPAPETRHPGQVYTHTHTHTHTCVFGGM